MSFEVQYLLVGNGRLAKHFTKYFNHLRMSFETWDRSLPEGDLQEKIARAQRILLLVSDLAIEDFYKRQRRYNPEAVWIHCSGTLEIQGMHAFHPLMTFGPEPYDLITYNRFPFITTSSLSFERALPGLSNPCYKIAAKDKAKYHALCVVAGNFSSLLWRKLITDFREIGLPQDVALPFAEQTIANVFADPERALTGPLAREDQKIQAMNLQALEGDPYQDLYRAFQTLFRRQKDNHEVQK